MSRAGGLLTATLAGAFALSGCAALEQRSEPPLAAYFDCLRENEATLISAHRGGYAPGLPENAIETFQASVESGLVLLEMDVRRTADGVLVLLHDETLDRTTTGEGALAQLRLADLADMRLEDAAGQATSFAVPTLDQALAWSKGRAIVQLDVKRGVPFAPVVAAVRRAGAEERTVIITYNVKDAAEVHRLAPDLMISASVDAPEDLDALLLEGVNPARILAWTGNRAPNPALWTALRAKGVEPMFGTLGGRDSLDAQIEQSGDDGAYATITADGSLTVLGTNRAPRAKAALQSAGLGAVRSQACDIRPVLE